MRRPAPTAGRSAQDRIDLVPAGLVLLHRRPLRISEGAEHGEALRRGQLLRTVIGGDRAHRPRQNTADGNSASPHRASSPSTLRNSSPSASTSGDGQNAGGQRLRVARLGRQQRLLGQRLDQARVQQLGGVAAARFLTAVEHGQHPFEPVTLEDREHLVDEEARRLPHEVGVVVAALGRTRTCCRERSVVNAPFTSIGYGHRSSVGRKTWKCFHVSGIASPGSSASAAIDTSVRSTPSHAGPLSPTRLGPIGTSASCAM